jgi:heme exporter protein C
MLRKSLYALYWLVAAATFAGALYMIFAWTPYAADRDGEPIVFQKILYFHMPVAINTFLACMVCCVGGVGYLLQRQTWWDDLASAAAKVAVIYCTGVLLTGMLWAHGAWNLWWTWSPRLTFSFMLWLLYVVYLLVRMSIEGAQRRAVVSAVYGLVAFLDVPLVYLSARLLPDLHPGDIGLTHSMQWTLGLSFIPITLVLAGLIALQYKVHRVRRSASDLAAAAAYSISESPLPGGAA